MYFRMECTLGTGTNVARREISTDNTLENVLTFDPRLVGVREKIISRRATQDTVRVVPFHYNN